MRTCQCGDMRLRTISGKVLSPLAFGAMQFGGKADEAASEAMYDAVRAAGINHIDTAVGYTDGQSERLVGQFVRSEREKVYVATKIGFDTHDPDVLRRQWTQSRKQLGLDVVDLLYLHRFDPAVELEEPISLLAELQSQGAIRHIGLSNFSAWQVMKAQAIAHGLGTRIDVIQPMYNLVKRQAEVEIIPMAVDQGIRIVPYSPLGGGLLSGKYAVGETGRVTDDPMYAARYGQPWMHKAAERLTLLADEAGVHPATLAVAWVAAHPASPRPLISARSLEQLHPSLVAADYVLSPEMNAALTALIPSPPPATDRTEEA